MTPSESPWPRLDYASWSDTLATLHLWTQIVGKVRLALSPWVNHGWHVALYVSARGLGTSPIPAGNEVFEIDFDFIAHQLVIRTSRGEERRLALGPHSVAHFYRQVMSALQELGIRVSIKECPNEVPDPIPFSKDLTHHTYDAAAAQAFWRALVQVDRLFKEFRSGFLGKVSPVHFFWGSFDLAVTRFSGRLAPLHPGGVPGLPDDVAREAYTHEVSSAGFWPGNAVFPAAAFYSYAYPEPQGFRDRTVPAGAYFDTKLGEFILPYEAVRRSRSPEQTLLAFITTTYTAGATLGGWDRKALERPTIRSVA